MFIYPPRPCGKIPAGFLKKKYTPPFWCGQRKFNGTRNGIDIGEGKVKLWTRHGTPNKLFDMPNSMRDQFLSLGISNSYLDGELLHSKTQNIKGKIVLFDVLKLNDKDLFGSNQMDRLWFLDDICNHPREYVEFEGINLAFKVTEDIWMAETFYDNLMERYREAADIDEVEGLVLRRVNSELDNLGQKEYEVPWQIRVRKPHKNYNY